MRANRAWQAYPPTYRQLEMKQLCGWIRAGESGSVVALPGMGRATLLDFLCHHPSVASRYFADLTTPPVLLPVDLNNLPNQQLATLYRAILRALFEENGRFPPPLQPLIEQTYRRHEAARDPFLPQSGLRELLLRCEQEEVRLVLVINRFDQFCQTASPQMIRTLRGLRDSFKRTLTFLMGMRTEVRYFDQPTAVQPLRHIINMHTCRVGPLSPRDGQQMIKRELGSLAPDGEKVAQLDQLTGGIPSLIRVVGQWWSAEQTAVSAHRWEEALLTRPDVRFRLGEIWQALTQEEQFVLHELQKAWHERGRRRKTAVSTLTRQHESTLSPLSQKGICTEGKQGWQIACQLLETYIADVGGRSRGRLWLDERSETVYLGQEPLENIQPQPLEMLKYLLRHPHIRHTHDHLIDAAWPENVRRDGVTPDAVYQTVRNLRRHIEPNPATPRYLLNWRGQGQSGYQLFPEGKPGS